MKKNNCLTFSQICMEHIFQRQKELTFRVSSQIIEVNCGL